jgi:hypothetical protein
VPLILLLFTVALKLLSTLLVLTGVMNDLALYKFDELMFNLD